MNLRTLLLLSLALFSLASCKDMVRGKDMAAAAIVDFHQQFNPDYAIERKRRAAVLDGARD